MARKTRTKRGGSSRTGFILSDEALAALARDYAAGVQRAGAVRGRYLPVLVAHTKRELDRVGAKRPQMDTVLAAIDAVHDHHYAIILEAITTPDLVIADGIPDEERQRRTKERNRRSNFARSAKSTLVSYVRAGGKVAGLDPAEVTKEKLRQLFAPTREGPIPIEERLETTEARLEALVKKLAAEDMDEAQRVVERLHVKLAELVEIKPVARGRVKRGEVTLHPTAH
jgi:hypothetical protein